MSFRLQSQLLIDNLPDEQNDGAFEVIMPTLKIGPMSDTMSTLVQKSGLSFLSSLFEKNYTPIVEEIKFGVKQFGTETRRIRTGWLNVPDDIQNLTEVKIVMFCSNAMLTQYYLESWKRLIFNEEGEYYNPMDNYKRNIEVYFYGLGNVGEIIPPSAHYTLVGCFPCGQSEYTLKYSGQPKRLTLCATFKVDKITFDQNLIKSSIVEEIIGAPLAITDKLITSLSSTPSTYELNKTYD